MAAKSGWRVNSKCNELTPRESDKKFFPGRGGKIQPAAKYCADCPVYKLCLVEAIEQDLDGFYAGTTKDERRAMARFMSIVIKPLRIPEPPKKRRVFRKIVIVEDVHAWLDKVEGPDLLDLA